MTLNSLLVLAVLTCAGTSACPVMASAQPKPPDDDVRADSLARAYREASRTFTTPELERRMAARRAVQRNGYCASLAGVLRRDAVDALFSYLRMRLQLEFSLPHDQLFAYVPSRYVVEALPGVPPVVGAPNAMTVVPLSEDRSFPQDPWKRK